MTVTFDTAKIESAATLAVSSMDSQPYQPTLLDVPVSVFADAWQTTPEGVTTLRRIVTTGYYRPVIEAIRIESDEDKQKERKKQLRAFTPVALLHHRRKGHTLTEQVKQQWPLLMGDIDEQDNPHVDMSELKRHLCRLPYVLLCAHSVRGGLWFIVRLPDGQTAYTLSAHFRYLQRIFSELFGITLDASKGSNPTALRYVSYDATPYLNDAATIMYGQYNPPKSQPRRRDYTVSDAPDTEQLINRIVRFAGSAADGNRHDTLLKAATIAGGYIGASRMDEQTAVYALETIASEWPNFGKSQKTIWDGIRYGLQMPIYPESKSDYRPPPAQSEPQRRPTTSVRGGTRLKRSTNQSLLEILSQCLKVPIDQVPLYQLTSLCELKPKCH